MAAEELDLHRIDDVIGAMYAAISGAPGERDFSGLRRLFHPRAQLVRTGVGPDGLPIAAVFTIEQYERNASELLRNRPFHEIETARRSVRFGNVAQVFSAYEARSEPLATTLIKRGINMIHLYDDGARWWIMQMIWDDERDGVTIPANLFETESIA